MLGNSSGQLRRALVLGIFFISGWAALGYQVLWSKHVLAFIGVSAYSYATVLASFMAGLALGGRLLGRLADRSRSPLKLYAYLEIGIAAYAVLYPSLDRLVQAAYGSLVSAPADNWDAATGLPLKVLAAGLLLLPPTILMGATLPAMVRHATESLGVLGQRVSRLYAWNAFGSAIGALFMAFVLIPSLGLQASLMLLAVVNLMVAVAALSMSHFESGTPPEIPEVVQPEPVLRRLSSAQEWLVLGTAFTAGWLSFTYEIAWTRIFSLVLGSSTYAFALMLAAFITGIAGGSLLLARLDPKVSDPLRLFGWTQLAAALLVIVPLPFYPLLPRALHFTASLLSETAAAFYLFSAAGFLICFALMLPPTIFIGMAIPLLVKGLSRRIENLGADTGRAYAWNTSGNVLGALTAGLLLLPLLGSEWLLRSTALAGTALGLLMLLALPPAAGRGLRTLALPATIATVAVIIALFAEPWNIAAFTIEPFRRKDRPATPPELEIAYTTDDAAGHILVASTPKHDDQLTLWINGKADASSYSDMPTQLCLGHVPLLLHADPEDVLIIGLGSGATAGAALLHPVKRVDVVEILRRMPEASQYFAPYNREPWTDQRFNLIVDDARSYLSHTKTTYDVIISEPSNPWVAGCAALFSSDFYSVVLKKLHPDGLYVQWTQAYELNDETLASIVRTLRLAFPYVYGFQGRSTDLLFIGSRRPIEPDWPAVVRTLTNSEIGADLASAGIPDLETLLFLQRISPATADALAATTDMVTNDDNLFLEYRSPHDLFQRAWPEQIDAFDERRVLAPSLFWSQLRHLWRPGQRSLSPYEPFFDPRLAHPVVAEVASEVEFHNLELGQLLFDHRWPIEVTETWSLDPPMSVAEIGAAVDHLLTEGRDATAAKLIKRHHQAIIHESTLSTAGAAMWATAFDSWRAAANPAGEAERELHQLEIEIAAAGGRTDEAAASLASWMSDDSPPPPTWTLLTACRLERDRLCRRAAEQGVARTGDPFFTRYLELLDLR